MKIAVKLNYLRLPYVATLLIVEIIIRYEKVLCTTKLLYKTEINLGLTFEKVS